MRLKTFIAPWAEIAYLKRELIGARASCSAEAKRANRLSERIKTHDRALEKRAEQIAHDHAYITALEDQLAPTQILAARMEIRA